MASFIFPSALMDMATGGLDFMRDGFSVMLLDPSGIPDEGASVRSEIKGEVMAPGYRAGGQAVETDITVDEGSDGIWLVLGGADWPSSSILAGFAAYYRNTGDEFNDSLVALVDFGGMVQSVNDMFRLTETRIRLVI